MIHVLKTQMGNNKVNHSLMVIFMAIVTLSGVLSLQMQEASALTFTTALADDPDNDVEGINDDDTITLSFGFATNASNNGALISAEVLANFSAKHLRRRVVGIYYPTLVMDKDTFKRGVKQGPEPLFALFQRGLCPVLIGDLLFDVFTHLGPT